MTRGNAAYARAEVRLRGMGLTPTDKFVVERRYHVRVEAARRGLLERLVEILEPILHAQEYSESDTDGEGGWNAWEGYPDSDWVGTVYAHKYSDGRWVLGNWDHYTDPNINDILWANQEGNGYAAAPQAYAPHAPSRIQQVVLRELAHLWPSTAQAQDCDYKCRARRWAICLGAGCASAMTAGWLSGPGWVSCAGAWCAGAAVGCIIPAMFS